MSTVSLIRADCRRVMPSFPDGFVDLVVTSPPYDAGKEYEGRRKGDPGAAAAFARSWAPLVPRLLTSRGSFWLNVGYLKTGRNTTLPLTYVYYDVLRGTGLQLVQEIVWHYEGGEAYKLRYTHRTERWQWWARDADRALFDLDAVRDPSLNRTDDRRNNPLGKNPTDYWYFNRVVAGTGRVEQKTGHPCQFPERMIERVITGCSRQGALVLDPFVGSGTTCVVADRLGRRSIGIESNGRYLRMARKRLEAAG